MIIVPVETTIEF